MASNKDLDRILPARATRPATHFHPGAIWRERLGSRIRAHGAGLVAAGGRFYWYGAHGYRQPNSTRFHKNLPCRQINVYSSTDLYNWDSHRTPAFVMPCANRDGCYVDRPKVLKAADGTGFVMWLKSTPYVAVAISATALGPFQLRARWRPDGQSLGDMSAFVDTLTAEAYLMFSVKPTAPGQRRVLRVSRMTSDRLNLSEGVVATIPFAREAPAVFVDADRRRYYAWTSRPRGWRANAAEVFTAPGMGGPWTSLGNPTSSATSFNSQAAFVLPLPHPQRFLYVADRFDPYINTSESGRYVWLPLSLESGRPVVRWRHSWRIDDDDVWSSKQAAPAQPEFARRAAT